MKKYLFLFVLAVCSKFAFAQNGLEGIIVEKYYISNAADAAGSVGALPAGSTTYRIYVDLLPGYTFQAAYGVANHELRFQTTTAFFNNEDWGSTTPNFTKTRLSNNTVMLDTWLSGGAACVGNFGVVEAEDAVAGGTNVVNANGILANNDPNAGQPLSVADGIYAGTTPNVTVLGFTQPQLDILDNVSNTGNLISTFNASWAVLGGATGPLSSNKVLIGQFTTNGTFSFKLNIQIGTPTPGVSQNYVAENATGNEILFPGLIYPAPANPTALVSIAANKTFPQCQGTSVTFTATPTNGGATPTYQWRKNGVVTGTNSPTYTTTGLANSDVITCRMTSSIAGALNNPATSNAITASILSAPSAPITTTGPTAYCSGVNACTLSTNNIGGLSYQWIKGVNNVAGATAASYVPTSTTSASYKVRVTNSLGCSKTSTAVAITVNANPTATVTANGPTTFCSGQNLCTLNANAGTGLTYQWIKGTTNISGATAASYVPTTSSNNYKVRVTNANGCSKTSSATAIVVNANPTATITPLGSTTFCAGDSVVLQANAGAGLTYQWRQGTALVAGAVNQNFSAKLARTYYVIVTNANGCSKTSAGVKTTINCREDGSTLNGDFTGVVSVYPNPTNGVFSVVYTNESAVDQDATIQIADMAGRILFEESTMIMNGRLQADWDLTSVLSTGVYFVRINTAEGSMVNKVIVE
jgi:hypothetical protein